MQYRVLTRAEGLKSYRDFHSMQAAMRFFRKRESLGCQCVLLPMPLALRVACGKSGPAFASAVSSAVA